MSLIKRPKKSLTVEIDEEIMLLVKSKAKGLGLSIRQVVEHYFEIFLEETPQYINNEKKEKKE